MRVLFFDAATSCGVAIDDAPVGESGMRPKSFAFRSPKPVGDKQEGFSFGGTFAFFEAKVGSILSEYQPDLVGLETPTQLFGMRNTQANTIMLLVNMAGLIEKVCYQRRIPCQQLTPGEIKRWATGHGHAKKPEVQDAIERIFRWEAGGDHNRADAMAGWGALKSLRDKSFRPHSTPLFARNHAATP